MIYELIKVAHLTSMVLWIGSAFTVPMAVLALSKSESAYQALTVTAFRRAYVWVGGVGIIGTWVFGLALLSIGQWFNAPWMWAKLAVVIVLSGLHGALSGRLKKLAQRSQDVPTRLLKSLVALHAIGLLAVLSLVIFKPL